MRFSKRLSRNIRGARKKRLTLLMLPASAFAIASARPACRAEAPVERRLVARQRPRVRGKENVKNGRTKVRPFLGTVKGTENDVAHEDNLTTVAPNGFVL